MSDDCAKVIHELRLYLDGEVRGDIASLIARHLQECPPCEYRAEFERRLRAMVAAKCSECAPAELRERIIIEINSL